MKENELEVLKNYDIEVKNTRKIRGAILCETNRGPFLLKEINFSSKRIPELHSLYQHIEEQGYKNVDVLMPNRENEFVTETEEGTKYLLKKWFFGKECDTNKEQDILEGVQNLALLHRIMKIPREGEVPRHDLREEILRHNRELKKVRSFVRDRVSKGEFELNFLKNFDKMFEWAEVSAEKLKHTEYDRLLVQSEERGCIVHGDYNYHNILITPKGIATTNFERFHYGIQMSDFYYFLRKTMEKNQWDIELGHKVLECYNRILPLTEAELSYLAVCIAYPEKFWKSANAYYRSRKAWISEKSLEKLNLAIRQADEKRRFLERVFSFQP